MGKMEGRGKEGRQEGRKWRKGMDGGGNKMEEVEGRWKRWKGRAE